MKIFIHSSLNYIIFLLFIISSKNSFFTFLGLLNFTLTISSIIVVAVFFVYKKFQWQVRLCVVVFVESWDRKVFSLERIVFLRIGLCLQALLFPTTPTTTTGFQVFFYSHFSWLFFKPHYFSFWAINISVTLSLSLSLSHTLSIYIFSAG